MVVGDGDGRELNDELDFDEFVEVKVVNMEFVVFDEVVEKSAA
jgi:hypothetical protein